jgi:hypothetical protein
MLKHANETNEKKIVWLIAILVSTITIIPFLAGYLAAGDRVYLGVENIPDGYTYLAYVKSNLTDNILISQNFTTSERQTPTLPNFYFAFVAIVTKITGISVEFVYFILKTLLILPFVFILWYFLHEFFHTAHERITALIVLLFGGGVGWILWLLSFINPWFDRFDSTGLEYGYLSNLFASFHHPLVYVGVAFMMIGFILQRQAIQENSLRKALLVNLAIVSVYFVHPVDILVFVITIGLMILLYKREWFWTIIPSVGYIGIHTTLARSDIAYRSVQEIYFTWYKTVHPLFVPVVFGVLFIFFVMELRRFKLSDHRKTMLTIWSVSALILAYIIPTGIKMITIAFIPVFILGLMMYFRQSQMVQRILLVAILLGAPIILYHKMSDQMLDREYITKSDQVLFENASRDQGIVFVLLEHSGVMSMKTDLRPLYMDRYTTIDYRTKQSYVENFFKGINVREAALKYLPSYVLSTKKLDYGCLDERFVSDTYYYYHIRPSDC